ncbi:TlpA family protein disulfide reductase [Shimia sagamensis]|uniref:Thiol-disulfide isomerase or thioredoxin n=1 Tax=Shimia sagamensis TaxID=1566352 RepID=A0ABY1PAE0_9RHOB|nr:TlpA disulfide reductase family protein [Shimia sagamensis]SMP29473.1 Thiol-disulfide isomerase or thioredoxin [Shimia sagamensis]
MKLNGSALVYTGLAAIAIAALSFVALKPTATAETRDFSAVVDMRDGDMRKLNFHSAPKKVSQNSFITEDGGEATLADYKGKVVLLNFWATWCAPCRHEMPMLSELQSELNGDDFEVVTLATGRNMVPAMQKFFDEIGVDNLPLHRDPKQVVAREMAVFGLPATIIMDRDGREIARLQGDADWSSENARAILAAVIAMGNP